MKLYATTTSERASKGQGGNDYLFINLQDERNVTYGAIYIYIDEKYHTPRIKYWSVGMVEEINDTTMQHIQNVTELKGKSQKSEDWRHCKLCGNEFDINKGHNCRAI